MDEFDEKLNHTKKFNLEILKEMVARQMTHILNHFIKKYVQWVQIF
jgi:hypothetical protein